MKYLSAAFITLAFTAQALNATVLGINTDPSGLRGEEDTAYAIWDTFQSYDFVNDLADSSGGFTSVSLTQTNTLTGIFGTDQGAGVYSNVGTQAAGDDALYTGGRGATFTLNATTSFVVSGFYLQIKRIQSEDSFIGGIIPTLNGFAFDSVSAVSGIGDTNSNAPGAWSVTTYYWGDSLAGQNLTNLTLSFNGPTHRGIDGIVIDAVPEPSTWALLGFGAIGAFIYARRARRLA